MLVNKPSFLIAISVPLIVENLKGNDGNNFSFLIIFVPIGAKATSISPSNK